MFNPQYALENLLHIETTSKQETPLLHFNSPNPEASGLCLISVKPCFIVLPMFITMF
jgi:hypothetical protein